MDAKDVLIGVGIFAGGCLVGWLACQALRPREQATGGFLEGILQSVGQRIQGEISGYRMGQVPAWQVPPNRSPNYNVGSLWPETEHLQAKEADQVLYYL